MKENSVTSRLWQSMQDKNVSKADLARAAEVTPQAAGRWFKTNSISKASLNACAKYMGVSLTWLMTGEDIHLDKEASEDKPKYNINTLPQHPGFSVSRIESWDSKTPLDEDEVEVPFYMEVELSAGNGFASQIEHKGPKLRFSKSTLKRQGVDSSHAACVQVSGNSMEPVIPDGATVGIDTAKSNIKDGDMYAIDWDGALYIKTLYRIPGGGIRIRSFNIDEYPDENLTKEEVKHIRVIGRVFWYSVLR
ncbi:XRE family transcriptional regulator [Colwellia sp. E150_009]